MRYFAELRNLAQAYNYEKFRKFAAFEKYTQAKMRLL